MAKTAKGFEKEIEKAIDEQWIGKLIQFHKTLSVTVYTMVSDDSRKVGFAHGSPVMSGRYSSSHTIAINRVDKSIKDPHPDADLLDAFSSPGERLIPGVPRSEILRKLSLLKPFDNVIIANSLPYARRIEFGHSKLKAPEGVYSVTAAVVRQKFRNVKL